MSVEVAYASYDGHLVDHDYSLLRVEIFSGNVSVYLYLCIYSLLIICD